MAASPGSSAAAQRRALVRMQADLRTLKIIKTNQQKIVSQIQQLAARYIRSETLASNMRKKLEESVAEQISKIGG